MDPVKYGKVTKREAVLAGQITDRLMKQNPALLFVFLLDIDWARFQGSL